MLPVDDFIEKIASSNANYGISTKWFVQKIEAVCSLDEVMKMSQDEISDVLIAAHPTNTRMVSNCLNVLRKYAEYIGNHKFIECSKGVDVTEVWKKYACTAERKQRYLSHSDFQTMLHNMQMQDVLNIDYYITLMQTIYEGIYSDDLSALANIRGQDIHGNMVVVRCADTEPFELEITNDLTGKLKKLADLHTWQRKNRSGVFPMPIEGRFFDSCFKVENRNFVAGRDYKDSYYRYIRKVVEITELDFPLRAKNLYISGIMHRVNEQLKSKGMTLEQTFAYKRRWGEDVDIVRHELERVHYPYAYGAFTKLVTGYISDFQD